MGRSAEPIINALEPATAGPLVQLLSFASKGMAATRDQIPAYAEFWQSEAARALRDDRPVLVALGDSLSVGIGAERPELGFVGRIGHQLGWRQGRGPVGIVNLARSGAKIRDVIDRQLPLLELIPNERRLLTCTVGSNDVNWALRSEDLPDRMSELLAVLPRDTVVAKLPVGKRSAARDINRRIAIDAAARGLATADPNRHFPRQGLELAPDRFHPSGAGYQAWVDAFTEVVQSPKFSQ